MARERNGPEIRTASDRIIPDQRLFLLCARYWDRTSDLFRVREARYRCANRACKGCCFVRPKSRVEVATGFEPVYTALQAAASPLGQPTVLASIPKNVCCDSVLRADDEIRTRDIHLGKVVLYQLSYVRILEV